MFFLFLTKNIGDKTMVSICLISIVFLGAEVGDEEMLFIRGDANFDGVVNISDPVAIASMIMAWTVGEIPCMDSADADDSGSVGFGDVWFLLEFMFNGGKNPPAPFPEAGNDPTNNDGITCFDLSKP